MYQEDAIRQLHHSTEKLAKRKSCWYGFLYGIAVGLGATIGVAFVVGIILSLLQKLQFLPFIQQNTIQNIADFLKNNTPNFTR